MTKLFSLLEEQELFFSEIYRLFAIALTKPQLSAGYESTFSCLQQIKTKLSMGHDWLSKIAILTRAKILDFEPVDNFLELHKN